MALKSGDQAGSTFVSKNLSSKNQLAKIQTLMFYKSRNNQLEVKLDNYILVVTMVLRTHSVNKTRLNVEAARLAIKMVP